MRTLVVSPERAVADAVCAALYAPGHMCEHTRHSAGATVLAVGADVVFVDLDLTDGDGREVCRQLRASSAARVLALVTPVEAEDRVGLLSLGVDDYLVKPIDTSLLRSRVDALVKPRTSR